MVESHAALTSAATLWCLPDDVPPGAHDHPVLMDLSLVDVLIGDEPAPWSRLLLLQGDDLPPPPGATAVPLAAAGLGTRLLLPVMLWAMQRWPADDAEGEPAVATGDDGLHPTPPQVERFLAGSADQRPIMVNLLRYRDAAMYARYSLTALRYILGGGGRVLLSADVQGDGEWDQVAIAE